MKPYRKEKVGSLVHEVVGEAIAFKLNDPRVQPLTTVTRVVMSGDLLIANVYLSVPGRAADERRTLTAIRHAGGFLQRLVAQQVSLRQAPELRFEIDEAMKTAKRTLELLEEHRQKRPDLFAQPLEGDTASPLLPPDVEEEEEEDFDLDDDDDLEEIDDDDDG
jgi:ribosome-binding factor A